MLKIFFGILLVFAVLCAVFMSVAVCRLKTQEERDMDDEGQSEFIRELNSKKNKRR